VGKLLISQKSACMYFLSEENKGRAEVGVPTLVWLFRIKINVRRMPNECVDCGEVYKAHNSALDGSIESYERLVKLTSKLQSLLSKRHESRRYSLTNPTSMES
jgi:hypothetical protein